MSIYNTTGYNMLTSKPAPLRLPLGERTTMAFGIETFTAIKVNTTSYTPAQFLALDKDTKDAILGMPVAMTNTDIIFGNDTAVGNLVERPVMGMLAAINDAHGRKEFLVALSGVNVVERVAAGTITRGAALSKTQTVVLTATANAPSGTVIHSNAIALTAANATESFLAVVSDSILFSTLTA